MTALRELAERWFNATIAANNPRMITLRECANELLVILDADGDGDGGAVAVATDAQVEAIIKSVHSGYGIDESSWSQLLVRAALEHFAKGERHA